MPCISAPNVHKPSTGVSLKVKPLQPLRFKSRSAHVNTSHKVPPYPNSRRTLLILRSVQHSCPHKNP